MEGRPATIYRKRALVAPYSTSDFEPIRYQPTSRRTDGARTFADFLRRLMHLE